MEYDPYLPEEPNGNADRASDLIDKLAAGSAGDLKFNALSIIVRQLSVEGILYGFSEDNEILFQKLCRGITVAQRSGAHEAGIRLQGILDVYTEFYESMPPSIDEDQARLLIDIQNSGSLPADDVRGKVPNDCIVYRRDLVEVSPRGRIAVNAYFRRQIKE